MKCKVLIESGEKDGNFRCNGDLKIDGAGFNLTYVYGGAECGLAYDGKILTHKSSGEIPVCMKFSADGFCLCEIGGSGLCGEIPAATEFLKVDVFSRSVRCEIIYALGGGRKKIIIAAQMDSEEK